MLELTAIARDTTLENDGVWTKVLGASFKVRALNSPRVQKEIFDLTMTYKDEDLKNAEVGAKYAGELVGKILVTDWKDIQANGEDYPFTRDHAIKLFSSPHFLELTQAVANAAGNSAQYLVEDTKELIEHLKKG